MSRKPSPLQIWRAQYAYVSRRIYLMKRAVRQNEVWGCYKVPRQQSILPFLREQASWLMWQRAVAQEESRRLWERNRQRPPEITP